MDTKQEIQRLDTELQHHKRELRHDVRRIKRGIEAARGSVSPSGIFERRPLLITGLALLAGFLLGYRKNSIFKAVQPAVEAGKPAAEAALMPAAKAALTTAAAQTASRAARAW